MKIKLPLLIALAALIGTPGLVAQDQPSPQPPAPPGSPLPPASTPPAPAAQPPENTEGKPGERDHEHDRDRRRDGDRHPGLHGQRDRPDDRPLRGLGGSRFGRIGEPQPYLGVMTSPVPPPLSAQLSLDEGFGLLVQEVLPNSPAATAGLQKHDILTLLNDQKLVEPGQLAALVRAAGKGSQVSLTVLRKGKEEKVSVSIGERVQPMRRRLGAPGIPALPDFLRSHEEMRKAHERMREVHERMRERHEQERKHFSPSTPGFHNPAAVPPKDILKEAQPGGGAQITVFNADRMTKLDGSKARLILKDEDGEIEVSAENGNRTLTAKNAKGEVVFSGPVNTDEERQAVPEQFRNKLDKIEVHQATDPTSGVAEAFAGASTGEDSLSEDGVQ